MAQRKKQIRICNLIAKNLLIEYYNNDSPFKKNKDSVKLFCQEMSFESDYVRRFLFKLTRQEVDNNLVGAVIKSLSPEYQAFVYYKYKQDLMGTAITQLIHVSTAQLNNWDKSILTNIYDAIRFRLTIKDIFHRNKIINMLEAIAALVQCANELDPARDFVEDFWVKSLNNYYDSYSQLLIRLDECVLNPDSSRMNLIIANKVANPFLEKASLADICSCTCGTIGRYEHDFENLVREYVCA